MDRKEVIAELEDLAHEAANAAEDVRNRDFDGARNALSRPLWPDTIIEHIREVEEEDEDDE